MKIQAAVLTGPNRRFEVETLDLEGPREGEVLVKIAACGVCHSDWHVATGDTIQPMPCVTGHEGAGVIAEVGPGVANLREGQHVALSWAPDCGECFYCIRGQPNLCTTYTDPLWKGVMLDGTPRLRWKGQPVYHYCGLAAFAEYAVVPAPACIPLPDATPLTAAALVGCAVATGVGAALYTAAVRPGESVVVYGAGGVGLNILQGAAMCGAQPIIAVDLHPGKESIARTFGATHFVKAGPEAVEAIKALTGGFGADVVIEAVGHPAVFKQAFFARDLAGTLVQVGVPDPTMTLEVPMIEFFGRGGALKPSWYGDCLPTRDFPLLIDLYLSGRFPLDRFVTETVALDQVEEAFAKMQRGEVLRSVVVF
jgi:Zn-dependent alcohol dehydrogenase